MGGKESRDASLTKFYKCHSQTKVRAVVSTMCENFFHTNEILSKYNSGCPVKFISNALMICQNHPNMALNSNIWCAEKRSKTTKTSNKSNTKEQIKQEIISEMNLKKHNN